MNVAVDDLQLGLGAAVDLAGFDVHGASSIGDFIVARIERQRNPGAALKPGRRSRVSLTLNPRYTVITRSR